MKLQDDQELIAEVERILDDEMGYIEPDYVRARQRILDAIDRRTAPPAAPVEPPKGKMCTHGRPFRWYGPNETITCQHCCLELGEQCPTCRGEGRVPAATPGTAPTPPSAPGDRGGEG